MIFLPLPFVVTLLILPLLLRVVQHARTQPRNAVFFALLLAGFALQSVILGLRWGYGLTQVIPLQATLAALVASLSWLAFQSLTDPDLLRRRWAVWPHLIPAGLVVADLLLWPDLIGATLILTFLGYGVALVRLALRGPDALLSTGLDGALPSHRALWVTAGMILASALTDLLISLDAAFGAGAHAASVVAVANAIALLPLGWAAAVASGGQTAASPIEEETPEAPPNGAAGDPPDAAADSTDDHAIIARLVDTAMADSGCFKDVDLNLTRLSRRLRLPARRISEAINRVHGKSVSQYVNDLRIAEACRLLEQTDRLIGQIMFDCGFQTKSNFNREFLRVTGQSPRQFRAARAGGAPRPTEEE